MDTGILALCLLRIEGLLFALLLFSFFYFSRKSSSPFVSHFSRRGCCVQQREKRQQEREDMAKLGEGDDRWIVKERDDGANVNNWWGKGGGEEKGSGWKYERVCTRITSPLVFPLSRKNHDATFFTFFLQSFRGRRHRATARRRVDSLEAPPPPIPSAEEHERG